MSTTCKVTVYVDQGHTNDPYSPSDCSRLAKADCLSRSNGRVVWIDFCSQKVNTGGWSNEDEDTCYITYKCQGCNYFCA